MSRGIAPDLRASPIPLQLEALKSVVVGGSKVPNGMPRLKDISDAELITLQHYQRCDAT